MTTGTIQLTNSLKSLFRETAQQLKGSKRRQFMAKIVKGLGVGGQTQAERELGWNRGTIRKGVKPRYGYCWRKQSISNQARYKEKKM